MSGVSGDVALQHVSSEDDITQLLAETVSCLPYEIGWSQLTVTRVAGKGHGSDQ